MRDVDLYQQQLGVVAPWKVSRVELDVKGQRVDVYAEHERLDVQRLYWWKRRLGWDAPRQALAKAGGARDGQPAADGRPFLIGFAAIPGS